MVEMMLQILSLVAVFITCTLAFPAEDCRPTPPTHDHCPRITPYTSYSGYEYTTTLTDGSVTIDYGVSTITGKKPRTCPTYITTLSGPGPSGTCTFDSQTCSYSDCVATTSTILSCPPLSTDSCCTNTATTTVYAGCPPPTCVPGCSSTYTETIYPPCPTSPPSTFTDTGSVVPVTGTVGTLS